VVKALIHFQRRITEVNLRPDAKMMQRLMQSEFLNML
jgi:hypothetical protein